MYLLVLALIAALASAVPLQRSEIAKPKAGNLNYRLPDDIKPLHYNLRITPNFNDKNFIGSVEIEVKVVKKTETISFHHRNLELHDITVTDKSGKIVLTNNITVYDKTLEIVTIKTLENLKVEEYVITTKFKGNFGKDKRGFYYGEYLENNKLLKFASTHFEPTSARAAFPCFDEPGLKATFTIYITRPSNYNSVSNGVLKNTRVLIRDVQVEDVFEKTEIMSTYLVAFIISQMSLGETPTNSIKHQVLARTPFIEDEHHLYAITTGSNILQNIGTFLNVPYTLNHMIQAAIPDKYFIPGAMENWGLVIYRESYLLKTNRTSTIMQQGIDTIIAHEFGHQWFGNLATPSWWEYLWLSEGFATYFQYQSVDSLKPDWRLMDQFVVLVTQNALEVDSSLSTRAMNHDAGSPTEISRLFDGIAYGKSGAVIRMMEAFLTTDIFKKGLTNYLKAKEYKTAIPSDLYLNLQKSLNDKNIKLPEDLKVNDIMNTWDSQKGYPLITVERNYNKEVEKVKLSQERFMPGDTENITFIIPINYAIGLKNTFNDLKATDWMINEMKTITVANLTAQDWIIVNKQEAYYYRVNYDKDNWKLLTEALSNNHSQIHVRNRAQLIDDSFNLAKVGTIHYSTPLNLSTYLQNEIDYIPFLSYLRAMSFLNGMILGTPTHEHFQDYVVAALGGAYKSLTSDVQANDTHTDKLNRVQLLSWLCNFNHEECRNSAYEKFLKWKTSKEVIPVDLEGPVLCGAMRVATEQDWEYLWEYNNKTEEPTLNSNIASALGCIDNSTIIYSFFDRSLENISKIDFKSAVASVTKSGYFGVKTSLDYIGEYFQFLEYLVSVRDLENSVYSIASRCTTQKQIDELERLANKFEDFKDLFSRGIDKAKQNLMWNELYLKDIHVWLTTTSSALALHISLSLNVLLLLLFYFV